MPFFYEFHLNDTKLQGIEIGFSHSRKWEEALDEAKLSIPFYESEEPISQYGLMEIVITEVDNYTDLTVVATETLNMLVYSDKVSATSQYNIWRHDINIIEYTAKLDAYIMASLARTRDLENTNLAKFEITDDGIIFNNGGDWDLNSYPSKIMYNQYVWLPPIHIQQNYYTDTYYTISQVVEAYQADEFVYGYLWSYNRRPTIFRIVNVDTGVAQAWKTISSSDIPISFTDVGNYYIEYGVDALAFAVGTGYSAGQYAIIKFYVKVIDRYQQTMYDVIQSIRQNVSKGGGIESEYYFDNTRIFDIDSSIVTYLKSIQIPQIYLENATARQMLIFVLSYINALPRLEYGEVLDTLGIEKFNLSTGEFVEENTYTKSGSQNINQIGTRSYSPLNQVLPSNMDEPTTYAPSQDGLQQVRATNLQITDSSFSIKLEKEIYTPKELAVLLPKVSFSNSAVPEFYIPDIENIEIPLIERLINIEKWKLKYVTDNFPQTTTKEFYDYDVGLRTNMVDNLYWQLGSKSINLSDVYGTLVNQTLFQNVIKLAIYEYFVFNMPEPSTFTYHPGLPDEVEVMVVGNTIVSLYMSFLGDVSAYKDLRFRFSYLSSENLVTKTDKEDLSQIDFYSEMRQNQDESIINVVRASRKNYGNLQRTGNKAFSFPKIHHSLSEQYEVGKKDVNGFTITQINRQFYAHYFLAEYFVTKHHNRESRQTIVDQTYRWRDNYAKTALTRHENYSDYVVIYPPTYNYIIQQHTKVYIKSVLFPKIFGILLGEDISDLETRATVALIRTDGMYEVEEEDSTNMYAILTPISAYPLKNGLAFTLGFDSNQVAGDGLVQRGVNWYNQAVRYTNEEARFTRFGFNIMPKYELDSDDYVTYPKITKHDYNGLIADRDIYFSTGGFDVNTIGDDALVVDKDAMTNFNLTYQLSFTSYYAGQYVLGQKFFDDNWLVNNPNSETVTTYLYLYKDNTEYELFDDMFIKSGYDSATQLDNTKIQLNPNSGLVQFIGTISLVDVTSWAIGDSDEYLHIACNEALNGFKFNPEHFRIGVKEIGNKVIYYEFPLTIDVDLPIDISLSATSHIIRNHVDALMDIYLSLDAVGHITPKYYGDANMVIEILFDAQGHIYQTIHGDAELVIGVALEESSHVKQTIHGDAELVIGVDFVGLGDIKKIFTGGGELVIGVDFVAQGYTIQTDTPSWNSNSSIDQTSAAVYYKNEDASQATVYIRVTGPGYDETLSFLVAGGGIGYQDFTGLTHNTSYTSTAYAVASGEATSETSSSAGTGFTTTQYTTENPTVAYNTKDYTSITWRYTNEDGTAAHIWAKLDSGSYVDLGEVLAGEYVDKQWTGLTHNTSHTTTFYAIATGELQSSVIGPSASVTTDQYTTETPSWSSNANVTNVAARVYYKNEDASTATVYITVNSVTKSVSVNAGSTGYQDFTGLTPSTGYTSVAYAIVSGEIQSTTSSAAGNFTTESAARTTTPSIVDSYYHPSTHDVSWKVKNLDTSGVATLYSDIEDDTPSEFVDTDIAYNATGVEHVHATLSGGTIYAKAQVSGELLSYYASQYEGV